MNFLTRIFDTSDFPPRWHCGNWSPEHGWLHILSDLGVWSAYLAIPFVLVYFILRRKDLPFRKIFLLFGAFILACGTTHLMEAIIFWWPAYRLAGGIKLLTAIVSWATVIAIVPVVPRVLAMRSPEELQREIDGRKKAEQALQQSNDDLERRIEQRTAELAAAIGKLEQERERFRTTLACIGDAVIATDTAGRVTFLNAMALTLTGCGEAQAQGSQLDDVFKIVDEASQRPIENPAMRALREGRIVGLANHTVLIAQDGTRRSIDDSAAPIRDAAGTIVGAVLVFRDVSDKRQADDALRDSERKFRQLADTIPQMAWIARPDGEVVWYNRRWHEYTGKSPEEMQRQGWEVLHDPEVLPEVQLRWRKSLAEGTSFEMVFPLRAADGSFRPFLTLVAPLRGEDGTILQWFGTNTDITHRRKLEDELRKLAAGLAEADRRKNEFLAVLAHELRNPLAPILTALELMRLGDNDERETAEMRDMMQRQIQQMVHLIDDLLDVSRISSGKIVLRKERLDLSEAVSSALEASRPLIDGARHELTVALPDEPLLVEGDRTRLAQVLSNLLANSAKYTPEGGRIWLTVSRDDGQAVLRVRDSGLGIPADMLPLIFDMFTQVDTNLGRSRRTGHRPGSGSQSGDDARRHGRGLQRRPRPGQRVRRAVALGRCAAGSGRILALPDSDRRLGPSLRQTKDPGRGRQPRCGQHAGPIARRFGARGARRP